jgi:hypothetical protein
VTSTSTSPVEFGARSGRCRRDTRDLAIVIENDEEWRFIGRGRAARGNVLLDAQAARRIE